MRAVQFIVAVSLASCSAEPVQTEVYRAEVAYGHAPPGFPDDGLQIVPDAQTKYPAIIRDCGGEQVEEIGMTDGMIAFQFEVALPKRVQILDCAKSKLPGLASLNRSSR